MLDQIAADVNLLLAVLDSESYQGMLSHYKLVELAVSDILNGQGDNLKYVYFPLAGIISLGLTDGKKNLEIALIGNEGMLGATLVLNIDTTPFRAVVQSKGWALQIPRLEFFRELKSKPVLNCEIKRYLYVVMTQWVQSSVCQRYHPLEQRLARLLLMMRDRTHSNGFYVTQDLLANMLGVRRVGVSKAACSLKDQRLVSYSRGKMLIDDSLGLEIASCSCYRIDNDTYARILRRIDKDAAARRVR